MKLIIKGLIIGLGKIIPGVSGGMLAITLGVYDCGIDAISNFFQHPKKNSLFLGKLGIGIGLSIVIFSNLIVFSLEKYYLATMLLFIGLIIGGVDSVQKVIKGSYTLKNVVIMSIPCLILLLLNTCDWKLNVTDPSFLSLVFIGMIEAFTMIVPGVSGTAILMMLGCYELIINTFSTIYQIESLKILLPFFIGIIIGSLVMIKVMSYLLNRFRIETYFMIYGLVITSIVMLFFETFNYNYTLGEVIIALILLVGGIIISRGLENN
ncbi:MAG: DUF368 domain-containing protein [Bacilli bacterium]|nr:DUF368 domain-containing protein [Bacilli bacterium]MDD4808683.1 DUF368 domain-containing protein [Bacilli bacterium]